MATDDVTPMATKVASLSDQTTGITIESFASAISGVNLNEHSTEIVAALGGIDHILNDYIRITQCYPEEGILTTDQMKQIVDIINVELSAISAPETVSETLHAETFWDKLYGRAKLSGNTFHLDHSDTVLHSICKNKKLADRLINLLMSKISLSIVSTILFSLIVFMVAYPELAESNWFFILDCFVLFAMILYFSLVTLSCNIPIMLLIMSGFDFWVKCGYAVSVGVIHALYMRREDDAYGHPNMFIAWTVYQVNAYI